MSKLATILLFLALLCSAACGDPSPEGTTDAEDTNLEGRNNDANSDSDNNANSDSENNSDNSDNNANSDANNANSDANNANSDPNNSDPNNSDPNNGGNNDANSENNSNNSDDPLAIYEGLEGLEDGALEEALYGLVEGHRSLGYNGARDQMFNRFDVHDGMIECVYTGRKVAPNGTRTPGNFNTEHSWPQNDGAENEPAKSDLHHLFPSDENANQRRGNHEFGETRCAGSACDWSQGGSELGEGQDGRDPVFQVREERRGDIARAHFYFSVRYRLPIDRGEESVLREWHEQDPPDELERGRNDAIEALQRNRNPFVDRPEFVEQIGDF